MNTETHNKQVMEIFAKNFFTFDTSKCGDQELGKLFDNAEDFIRIGYEVYQTEMAGVVIEQIIKHGEHSLVLLLDTVFPLLSPKFYPFVMYDAAQHGKTEIFNFIHMLMQLNVDAEHPIRQTFFQLDIKPDMRAQYITFFGRKDFPCELCITLHGLTLE